MNKRYKTFEIPMKQGEELHPGDQITFVLNRKKGSLSYRVNRALEGEFTVVQPDKPKLTHKK